jgi:hypothetical protein
MGYIAHLSNQTETKTGPWATILIWVTQKKQKQKAHGLYAYLSDQTKTAGPWATKLIWATTNQTEMKITDPRTTMRIEVTRQKQKDRPMGYNAHWSNLHTAVLHKISKTCIVSKHLD